MMWILKEKRQIWMKDGAVWRTKIVSTEWQKSGEQVFPDYHIFTEDNKMYMYVATGEAKFQKEKPE
jgi:hypothetical protein